MDFVSRSIRRGARWRIPLAAIAVLGVLAFAACGGDDEAAAPAPPAEPAPAEPAPAEPAPAETTPSEGAPTDQRITDYVAYTKGTDGPADMSLEPVKIGWVNNEGGSIAPIGETSTKAADLAVQYINEHTGGIGGHPLELVKCFVKNAEEEGLACAQQFLNDPSINVISYGGVSVGSDTIASTLAGAKPVIMAFANNPSDQTNPNTWTLFGSGPFALYGWGEFARSYMHAKTNAVIHPQAPGFTEIAQAVKEASDAAGVKSTIVGFDPNATDLVGALTAAGAQDADMISPMVVGPTCLAFERGLVQLGIDVGKVVSLPQCTDGSLREQYTGGDFPKFIYGIAQGGDAYVPDSEPSGAKFIEVLTEYGQQDSALDPWYPATFSQILTIAQFMNAIGVDNLTPEAITDQVSHFKGPLLLGPPIIQCGKYPKVAPAVCADGDYFFNYEGDGVFKRITEGGTNGWFQTPIEIQEKNGAVAPG